MMLNKTVFTGLIFLIGLASAGCPTANAPNSNAAGPANANAAAPVNVPPEFKTSPLAPSGNATPGIPDPNSINANSVPKGATPTPGIPDPKTLNKTPVPKGATPTPGIPDPKAAREQMNKTVNDANVVNQAPPQVQREAEQTVNDKLKTVRKPNQ
jgi:hypothetical protein